MTDAASANKSAIEGSVDDFEGAIQLNQSWCVGDIINNVCKAVQLRQGASAFEKDIREKNASKQFQALQKKDSVGRAWAWLIFMTNSSSSKARLYHEYVLPERIGGYTSAQCNQLTRLSGVRWLVVHDAFEELIKRRGHCEPN